MTDYRIALFIHVTAAVALFGGSTIMHVALHHARESRTVADARLWAGLIRRFAPVMPVLTVLVVLPAVYMVHDVWGWDAGWIRVAAGGVVLSMLAGPLVLAPRMQALGRTLATAADGPISPAIAQRLTDPVIWVTEQGLTGLTIAELALMTFKPGLTASLLTVVAVTGLGMLAAVPLRRRRAPTFSPAVAALSGD